MNKFAFLRNQNLPLAFLFCPRMLYWYCTSLSTLLSSSGDWVTNIVKVPQSGEGGWNESETTDKNTAESL